MSGHSHETNGIGHSASNSGRGNDYTVPTPRAEWIVKRRAEAERTGDSNMSQMHFARKGLITEEMAFIAHKEKIAPELVRSEVAKGHDASTLAHAMIARGLMAGGADGKSSVSMKVPGLGSTRLYALTPALLNGGFVIQTTGVPAAIAYMIQALILFLVLGSEYLLRRIRRRRAATGAMQAALAAPP